MTTTITYEGTMPGSRIQGELIERHEDGSVTVVHPDGNPWTYRVRPEHIIQEHSTKDDACTYCEALPGDNDHCVWDGTPHAWHSCDGIVSPDSNCPEAVFA